MTGTPNRPQPARTPPSRLRTTGRILTRALLPPQQYGMSYPKSGRTWLRAMIGHVLCARTGIGHQHLLNTRVLIAASGLPPLKWHHGGGKLKADAAHHDSLAFDYRLFDGKRILFLIRDPRDTLVSAYFHATRRIHVFDGNIATFVRSSQRGILKWISYHNMWHDNRDRLASFRVVTYESLHATPVPALRGALQAIGLDDATDEELEAAVEFARFENLKKLEAGAEVRKAALRPRDEADPDSFKVRKGRVGGYRQSLSADDIAFIEDALARIPCPLYLAYYPKS
jgi:hypothetical protein